MFCKEIIKLCLLFSLVMGLAACNEKGKEKVLNRSTYAGMEWIDLGKITFAKAIERCPKGWHLASRSDWDLLLADFPTEKMCKCYESGSVWIGSTQDCRQKYCETCMRCGFEKQPVVDELIASGFLKDGEGYWTIEESKWQVERSTMLFTELFYYEYSERCENDQCPELYAKCVRRAKD